MHESYLTRRGHGESDLRISARGFTLMELLIVMAIILVVSAIALPVVQSSVANYQLRAAVASVTGNIQSTRYQAISSGYPFRLVISKTAKTYQVSSDPEIDGVYANVGTAVPFAGSSNPTTLGADVTLQFGGGGSLKATTGTLTMVFTRANKTGTVTVSPYGNVNVTYAP